MVAIWMATGSPSKVLSNLRYLFFSCAQCQNEVQKLVVLVMQCTRIFVQFQTQPSSTRHWWVNIWLAMCVCTDG